MKIAASMDKVLLLLEFQLKIFLTVFITYEITDN